MNQYESEIEIHNSLKRQGLVQVSGPFSQIMLLARDAEAKADRIRSAS